MAAGPSASSALFALSLFLLIAAVSAKQRGGGFTLGLTHRDSINSPLYSPGRTHYAQIQTAITRSIARAKRFSSFGPGLESESGDPEADIIAANGEYVMNVSIGTPPFPIVAIADTGSDLIWTQCKPCSNCYEQRAPLFDSKKSSTYRPVSCSAPHCTTGVSGFNPSCDRSNRCQYSVSYGDQSTSSGSIATETFTLESTDGDSVKFPKTVFGCGFDNQGTFSSSGSGIIGLGNGPDSLIGQIDKSIGGKFSYCLVPLSSRGTKTSEINFGENAVVSGSDVVSTHLVEKDPATFFWLTLEALTIGKKRIAFTDGNGFGFAAEKGNIIIDSGTTLLILPDGFFNSVVTEIEKQVVAKRVDSELNLCYDSSEFKAPKIVVNFDGGDVKLNDYNAWISVSDGVVCFAAAPSDMGIYGNLAQMNFLVGYDKEGQTVSFKPADCTQHNYE